MVGNVACMVGEEKCIQSFGGKPVGRILLGRQRNRWEYMKMDSNKAGWDGMALIHLAKHKDKWQAILKVVMNLWVP